jgi:hypothetical protein
MNFMLNAMFDESIDGFIKVTIPSLGVVTWATDVEDAQRAISEAVESFKIQSEKYGEGFEKELSKVGRFFLK